MMPSPMKAHLAMTFPPEKLACGGGSLKRRQASRILSGRQRPLPARAAPAKKHPWVGFYHRMMPIAGDDEALARMRPPGGVMPSLFRSRPAPVTEVEAMAHLASALLQ